MSDEFNLLREYFEVDSTSSLEQRLNSVVRVSLDCLIDFIELEWIYFQGLHKQQIVLDYSSEDEVQYSLSERRG